MEWLTDSFCVFSLLSLHWREGRAEIQRKIKTQAYSDPAKLLRWNFLEVVNYASKRFDRILNAPLCLIFIYHFIIDNTSGVSAPSIELPLCAVQGKYVIGFHDRLNLFSIIILFN